ncbi:MAG TPA: CRTAC1 family protein, partial [Oceanospirillales bacterium]|nr:CRTAC1 family protein [Oceanospirillales bacterium]
MNKRQKLLVKWSVYFAIGVLALLGLAFFTEFGKDPAALNDDGSVEGLTRVLDRQVDEKMKRFAFVEVSEGAGIDFEHFPGKRQSLLPEDMGSGVAWGDYNNDGLVDLFLVNFKGSINDKNGKAQHGLYQNNGDGTFNNVTTQVGLDKPSYGMGVAWGDFDNDDDLDLYISNYGANQLYRNDGDAGFTDISTQAGVAHTGFGAGVSWGDFNHDGLIDLYLCNYVKFINDNSMSLGMNKQYNTEIPYTINPSSYDAASNQLYQNNGDGTFTDVAKQAGVENKNGRSLVAAWFDFDNDGYQDLYIANDISENGVYHNNQDGTFTDIGASSLAADYRGAMGLAVGDYDNDQDLDLFVTHWLAQENALFRNNVSMNWKTDDGNKKIFFVDEGEIMGLGQISLRTVGWSTAFTDFDNDGLLDLWVVNGSTLQQQADSSLLEPQQLHLFRQQQGKGFYEISKFAGAALSTEFVGRGGAQADFNNDGKIDLAIMRYGESPLLLENTSKNQANWIKFRLRQQGKNTRALGTRVKIRTADTWQTAEIGAQGLYLSQNNTDVHFGLGKHQQIDEIIIVWSDGEQQKLSAIQANQLIS